MCRRVILPCRIISRSVHSFSEREQKSLMSISSASIGRFARFIIPAIRAMRDTMSHRRAGLSNGRGRSMRSRMRLARLA